MLTDRLLQLSKGFERMIVVVLMLLLMFVIAAAVFKMVQVTFASIDFSGGLVELVTVKGLHEIFSVFLLVLIGIELLATVKMYLVENVIHVEVVFLVAMISVARHAIDLNLSDPLGALGTSALLVALTVGFFLLKKSLALDSQTNESSAQNSEARAKAKPQESGAGSVLKE